jgi:hypothetical protein
MIPTALLYLSLLLEGVQPTTLISRTLICADRLACSPDRVACLPRPVSDAARCPAPLSVCARPGAWCAVGNCLFYGMPRPARRSSFSAAGRPAARDSLIMTWDRSASVCTHRVLARASCPTRRRVASNDVLLPVRGPGHDLARVCSIACQRAPLVALLRLITCTCASHYRSALVVNCRR